MLPPYTPSVLWLLSSALLLAGAGALLYAALHDLAARTIPNTIPAILAGLGVGLRLFAHALLPGLGCAALVFLLGAFCWRRGWLGGGDVKLIAAGSLTVPPLLCPAFLAAVAMAGGVLAIIYALLSAWFRRRPPPRRSHATPVDTPRRWHGCGALWRRALAAERWRLSRGAPLPYATAIAAGYLFLLLRA